VLDGSPCLAAPAVQLVQRTVQQHDLAVLALGLVVDVGQLGLLLLFRKGIRSANKNVWVCSAYQSVNVLSVDAHQTLALVQPLHKHVRRRGLGGLDGRVQDAHEREKH